MFNDFAARRPNQIYGLPLFTVFTVFSTQVWTVAGGILARVIRVEHRTTSRPSSVKTPWCVLFYLYTFKSLFFLRDQSSTVRRTRGDCSSVILLASATRSRSHIADVSHARAKLRQQTRGVICFRFVSAVARTWSAVCGRKRTHNGPVCTNDA